MVADLIEEYALNIYYFNLLVCFLRALISVN